MVTMSTDELHAHLSRARLLVLDVDGVLTDGRVVYSDAPSETQAFDVNDSVAHDPFFLLVSGTLDFTLLLSFRSRTAW